MPLEKQTLPRLPVQIHDNPHLSDDRTLSDRIRATGAGWKNKLRLRTRTAYDQPAIRGAYLAVREWHSRLLITTVVESSFCFEYDGGGQQNANRTEDSERH
jgi:hypothetical protein